MEPRRPAPAPWFALLPATILMLATLNVSVPYFSIAPGPAQDVKPLIAVSGTTTYPSKGQLLLTTVSLRSVRVSDALAGWLDPQVEIVPRSAIIPTGSDDRQVDQENANAMEDSKRSATAAAMRQLEIPVALTGDGARVESVLSGAPADGVLRAGDVIVAVDAKRVAIHEDLVTAVQSKPAGTRFKLRVKRGDAEEQLTIRSAPPREGQTKPILGVTIVTQAERLDLSFSVEISSNGIGGPSAGLMFALGLVDLLDGPDDLTRGSRVAGTGVITFEGKVGRVGGVAQKVAAAEHAGARVFLVPADEAKEARAVARRIRVVPVRTLADAVEALRSLQRPVTASRADGSK